MPVTPRGFRLFAVAVVVAAAVTGWRLLGSDEASGQDAAPSHAERAQVADAIAVGLAGGNERGVETARAYLEHWGEEPSGLAAVAHAAIGRGLLAESCDGASEDGLCLKRGEDDPKCGTLIWGPLEVSTRGPAAVAEAREHLEQARDAAVDALPEGSAQRRTAQGAQASAAVALADLDLEALIVAPEPEALAPVVARYRAVTADPYWTPHAQARIALAHVALADALTCAGQRASVAGLVRQAHTALRACAEAVRKRRRGDPERTLCIRLLSAVQRVRTVADEQSRGGDSR